MIPKDSVQIKAMPLFSFRKKSLEFAQCAMVNLVHLTHAFECAKEGYAHRSNEIRDTEEMIGEVGFDVEMELKQQH